jgi:dUTPase
MFVKIEKPEFELVEDMGAADRGGFGTTGLK